jgi:hypothetical protein
VLKWHGAVVPHHPTQFPPTQYYLREDYPTTEPLVKGVSGALHISFCDKEDTVDWLYAIKYPAEALRFKYSMYAVTELVAYLHSELVVIVAGYLTLPDIGGDLESFIFTHTLGTARQLTDLTSLSGVWPHVHTLLKPQTLHWNKQNLPHYKQLREDLLAELAGTK